MDSTKVFSFPSEAASTNSVLASIMPALCNKGVDTAALMGMMSGNNGGLFGGRGFEDIIALIIVAAIFGNGNFGFGNNGGNSTERQMLMDAIQRNGIDISQLASALNCSVGRVDTAINSVATQICNLSAQSGQNTASIISSLQMGNQALTQQLCNCCCDIKQLVTAQGYENQLANCNQTNTLVNAINSVNIGQERGFSQVAYAAADQTCQLKNAIADNTRAVLGKLDAIERERLDEKIESLTAQNAVLTSRAERQAELAPIYKALSEIQCKQPETKTIIEPNNYIPVNYGVNVPLTYGCGCGFGFNAFGYPYGNGFTNGFTNAF